MRVATGLQDTPPVAALCCSFPPEMHYLADKCFTEGSAHEESKEDRITLYLVAVRHDMTCNRGVLFNKRTTRQSCKRKGKRIAVGHLINSQNTSMACLVS